MGEEHTPRILEAVPVVGVGASAGGLEALFALLEALPGEPGFALVIVQHLDPTQPSTTPELLSQKTTLRVSQLRDSQAVEAHQVYCVPPGKHALLQGDRLCLVPPDAAPGAPHPIDRFFVSLAESRGEESMVIALPGTAEDGSLGVRHVAEHGGLVLILDPEEAGPASTPQSALHNIDSGTVLPAAEMGRALQRLLSRAPNSAEAPLASVDDEGLAEVLERLKRAAHFDFSLYKPSMVQRRLARRMGLMGTSSLAHYLQVWDADPEEPARLARDLLIGVTRFFRDQEAWDRLTEAVVSSLLPRATPDRPLRVWVAGCSTGEEAVTVAICLAEAFARAGREPIFQIFATDVDERAVERGRSACYEAHALHSLSPRLRQRYFRAAGEKYCLVRELRERILFSVQDLLRNPPFSRLDLISCRNVLIYFKPEAQRRAFALFHFGLNPGGLLFLGAAENPSPQGSGFESVSLQFRIHLRGKTPRKALPASTSSTRLPQSKRERSDALWDTDPAELTRSLLLEHFAPTAVLLDGQDRVLFESGDTGRFMGRPRGTPTLDLDALLHTKLRTRVRQLLAKARASAHEAKVELSLPSNDAATRRTTVVRIFALPLGSRTRPPGWVLMTFVPVEDGAKRVGKGAPKEEESIVQQLERELSEVRLELRSLLKDSATSQEELKASHEEVLSMNEELQSSNEELETSKEELQSLNEELSSVNAELSLKLAELEETNDDLVNLVESTRIPTIFLDREGCIKRYTPGIRSLFHVIPGDLGRPLADLAPRFEDDTLVDDVRRVMQELTPRECEVSTEEGARYIRRAHPYRTRAAVVAGVVVSFFDITPLHTAREAAIRRLSEVEHVFAHAPVGLAFIDRQFRFARVNHQVAAINGISMQRHIGRSIRELFPDQADAFERINQEVWATGQAKESLTVEFTPAGQSSPRRYLASYFPFRSESGEIVGTLASAFDITEREQLRESLHRSQKLEAIGRLASGVAHDFNNVLQGVVSHTEVIAALSEDARVLEEVREIKMGVRRAGEVVRQLVTFGSHRGDERAVVPFSGTVREALRLVRASIPNSTGLVIELPEEDRGVNIAPSGVVQLLLNLVTNAHQAARPQSKHEVHISLRFDASSGVAELSVVDHGRGMSEDVTAHLFEPYFTTKGPHEGSGLGMSVVLGVVEGVGGTIDVQSRVGEGTRVTVRFPSVPLEEVEITAKSVPPPEGNGQRILLIDDEPAFVRSTRRLLRAQGYEVEGFTRPEDAMDRFRGAPEDFDVIVTDLTMPGMSGMDLISAVRRFRPELPALLCTGFWEASEGPPENVKVFLKPVSVDVIARHLYEVLGGEADVN